MSDMSGAIVAKSDQTNADDLIAGPITIKITDVTVKPGEQPVSIFFEGDNGKPYKCCKSMARVLVHAWGADSKKYIGRSLTLYRDASVKWGGMEVGGIRISHMSDIDSALTMALTMTRANKKPFTVRPLLQATTTSQPPEKAAKTHPSEHGNESDAHLPDPLLVKAAEWAECGMEKYKAFWIGLTDIQRKHIGAERHEQFKATAELAANVRGEV